MPTALSVTLLPLTIILCFLFYLWVRNEGGNLEQAVLISGVCIFALTLLLEKWFPENPQRLSKKDYQTDWISLVVILGLIEPLIKTSFPVLIIATSNLMPLHRLFPEFPGELGFGWQVLIATLTVEFLFYWAHRWHHSIPSLWWLHALHHNPEKIYSVNGLRLHPLNHMLNSFIAVFPLAVIGTPTEVLLAYLAVTQPIIILQHANLNLRHGVMNHLLSTNQIHRWHHSCLPEEGNSNYGRSLVIFDKLFGTFYLPDRNKPTRYGLYKLARYPSERGYWGQITSIFRPECCR